MSTDQVRFERRATQRFDFHLPVTLRLADSDSEGYGFTQDLSARGALLYTDFALSEGDAVELTLVMPSEITLAEDMRVRCRGKVMRVCTALIGTKFGVAVHLEGYEYLPEITSATATFARDSIVPDKNPEENEMTAHTFQMRSALQH
jgi:PilZ domain